MKGTVPKRLDISYYFGTFHTILNFYFRIILPSATQHPKFLTSSWVLHTRHTRYLVRKSFYLLHLNIFSCRYILKLEIVITRAAPAFHKLFMVMGLGCVFDINTVHKTGKN